ncbi:MAG: hypothetical protein KY445_17360 [Armatimonadetes bacterium]|nr:hypothetical protein [Armatimonadota bacterium]
MLLFGLCASFVFAPVAFAQNAPSTIAPSTETVTDAILQPIADKSGVCILGAGNYNFRKLLTLLTAKTGAQAYFDTHLGPSAFVTVAQPLQGTVPELIAQLIKKIGPSDDKLQPPARTGEKPSQGLGSSEVVARQVGTDWLFLRVKPKWPVGLAVTSPPPDPIGFRFNINRSPRPANPKNLPPDAVPFEFNGERVYYVPLPAKGK